MIGIIAADLPSPILSLLGEGHVSPWCSQSSKMRSWKHWSTCHTSRGPQHWPRFRTSINIINRKPWSLVPSNVFFRFSAHCPFNQSQWSTLTIAIVEIHWFPCRIISPNGGCSSYFLLLSWRVSPSQCSNQKKGEEMQCSLGSNGLPSRVVRLVTWLLSYILGMGF